jgi:hypothetical protein
LKIHGGLCASQEEHLRRRCGIGRRNVNCCCGNLAATVVPGCGIVAAKIVEGCGAVAPKVVDASLANV